MRFIGGILLFLLSPLIVVAVTVGFVFGVAIGASRITSATMEARANEGLKG